MRLSHFDKPSVNLDAGRPARYRPPSTVKTVWLRDFLHSTKRGASSDRQLGFFCEEDKGEPEDIELFYAGDLSLLDMRCVSIVGTREATAEGAARANRLARELVSAGIVVVSGLARGIDAAAHKSAVENGGRTVAVIG